MPDENKFETLRSLPYVVQKVCGLCKHGVFPNNDWGSCSNTAYQHKKHTGDVRQVSIVKAGSCSNFELDETKATTLGAHREFLTV